MEAKITTIRGLAIDVIVIETMHSNGSSILFYSAEIFVRSRRTGVQQLARRTRIPGTGPALARDVQRMGLRALNSIATA